MPVSDELIQLSPSEIRKNGPTSSTHAKATIAPKCARVCGSTPRFQAMGSSTIAPSAIRPNATPAGDTSASASLMKK
jgi:hypothetical protein